MAGKKNLDFWLVVHAYLLPRQSFCIYWNKKVNSRSLLLHPCLGPGQPHFWEQGDCRDYHHRQQGPQQQWWWQLYMGMRSRAGEGGFPPEAKSVYSKVRTFQKTYILCPTPPEAQNFDFTRPPMIDNNLFLSVPKSKNCPAWLEIVIKPNMCLKYLLNQPIPRGGG